MADSQLPDDYADDMLTIRDKSVSNLFPYQHRELVCYDHERVRRILSDAFFVPSNLEKRATRTRQDMDKMICDQKTDDVFDEFAALADRIHDQRQQRLGQPVDGKSKPSTARLEHLQAEQTGVPHRTPARLSFCGWPTLQVGNKKWLLDVVINDVDGRACGYIPSGPPKCAQCTKTTAQQRSLVNYARTEYMINLERPGANPPT